MIKLISKKNVSPPSSTYPYGQIKDDSGLGDGTSVDVKTYGDFHQFFARLFNQSGLTANDLPENETNGFQLIEALDRRSKTNYHKNKHGGDLSSF